MKCKKCGSQNITHLPQHGVSVCMKCSQHVDQSSLVGEKTFFNQHLVGKSVMKTGPKSRNCELAYKMIQETAAKLKLDQSLVESAQRVYDLAQQERLDETKNKKTRFVKGRPRKNVVASALYLACRRKPKLAPLLLIDFSDLFQTNLYELGACYLKLVKFLHQESDEKIPQVDPSLFIHRFCHKLNFGEKTTAVSKTALRLIQRFNRDWMCYGRRPTSLCGAAILISARYHGFTRTTSEIADTLHVCEETLRKRVDEFKETKVAKLTREEFEKLDLMDQISGENDPPAYTRNIKKLRIQLVPQLLNGVGKGENSTPPKAIEDAPAMEEEKAPIVKKEATNVKKDLEDNDEIDSNLEDVADEDIDEHLLTEPESLVKSIVWHHMHREWLEEQERKKSVETKKQARNPAVAKKKSKMQMIDAQSPADAISHFSELRGKVNPDVLADIFPEPKKRFKEEEDSSDCGLEDTGTLHTTA